MESGKQKHLELIQGVINRLAVSSFQLKGWSVTLVVGVLVFSASMSQKVILLPIALLSVLVFWGLDAYFLRQERIFRYTYDTVRNLEETEIDFKMPSDGFENVVDSWWKVIWSKTLSWFHGCLFVPVAIFWFLITFSKTFFC